MQAMLLGLMAGETHTAQSVSLRARRTRRAEVPEPDSGASYPDPVRDHARKPERCGRSAAYEGTLADSTRPIQGYRPSRTLLN
jgi:hypothetical protein